MAILSEAMEQVKETVNRAASSHRDLHSSVSKVGKAIRAEDLFKRAMFLSGLNRRIPDGEA